MLLDDQVVKTQAMRASPFIKPLEAAALSWEKLLLAAQVRTACAIYEAAEVCLWRPASLP